MDKILLSLLKDYRFNIASKPVDIDYEELYKLADGHQVSAMIYNQIYNFESFPAAIKQQWRNVALRINAMQTMKSQRILQLYKKILDNNLKVIIVKGIILRNIYPNGDNRQSNDEDLYVSKEDFPKVEKLFLDNKLILVHASDDVSTYSDPMSGLSIELHTSLFSKDSKAYGKYQHYFDDAFNHTATHHIGNIEVLSLDHDYHFLFLILHFVKHFLHSGVGIRQVLDIIMYGETFGHDIDFNKIESILKYLNIDTLVYNLFALSYDYLAFDYSKLGIPKDKIINHDYDLLLKDIIDAGVFGQSSDERIHSSTMTLNALGSGKTSVMRSLFPTLKEMQAKYEYLNKLPVLLPVAYLTRIIDYIRHHKSNQGTRTIEIGHQRIELLKKYKVIK